MTINKYQKIKSELIINILQLSEYISLSKIVRTIFDKFVNYVLIKKYDLIYKYLYKDI